MDAIVANSILILEDEPLIAMDLEHMAEQTGFLTAVVLASCAQALVWLEHNTPSLAILDIRLRDGACSAIAASLFDRDVPFIVCSGSARHDVDPIFHRGIWVSKPANIDVLRTAFQSAQPMRPREDDPEGQSMPDGATAARGFTGTP